MELEPKNVADPVKADQPKQKKKVFRFIKTQAAAQPVVLADGKEISFQLKKIDRTGFGPVSTFETEDAGLAGELREVALKHGYYSIKEITR